jgi:DNA-binding NarL/FixJ family response regulator
MIKRTRIIVALTCQEAHKQLVDWVNTRPWLRLAGSCRSSEALVRAANGHRDAVLVTDGLMGENPIPLLAELHRVNPGLRIIAMLEEPEGQLASQVMRAGAMGIVGKGDMDGWQEVFIKALRGDLAMRGDLALRLMRRAFQDARTSGGLENLTARELQVFEGFTAKECGKDASNRLGISTKTVAAHRESIKRKLGCSTLKEVRMLASTARAEA